MHHVVLKMKFLCIYEKRTDLRSEISFDEPLNSDSDGNELLLSDILGTDEHIIIDDVEKKIERQHMIEAIRILDDRERYIMECRFGLNWKH